MACLAESYIRALRSAASHRSKPYKFRRFSHWGVSSRRPTICQIIRLVSGIAHFNTIKRRRSKHIIGENYAVDLPVPPIVEAKYFRCLQLAMGIVCMAMIANLQYGWTLFVDPIDASHWGRAAIQVAFALFVVMETWLAPIEGWFVDKYGPRVVTMFGGLMITVAWVMN